MEDERFIRPAELSRQDGSPGARMYVAFQGIVYDVTDCPHWRTGLHEGQHFPGQDLTQELLEHAPHKTEVFAHRSVVRIGRLRSG
jgi:predicted heme/steroid binding protein